MQWAPFPLVPVTDHSLDWLFQFGSEDPSYKDFIKDIGAVVMGSSTYEWILKHDTFADPEKPKPWMYKQPAWVFTSRTLKTIPKADIRFVKGDVVVLPFPFSDLSASKRRPDS